MKVKDFKDFINSLPDGWEIGYNEHYEEGPNVNHRIATRFKELENIKVDINNNRVILYEN